MTKRTEDMTANELTTEIFGADAITEAARVGNRAMPKCQHQGCDREGNECEQMGEDPPEFYCADHMQVAGYCYICGGFFAGIGNFETGNGLCENCDAEAKADSEDWADGPDDTDLSC